MNASTATGAKKPLLALAMLLLTLGAIETMARLTHHMLFDEGAVGRLEGDMPASERASRSDPPAGAPRQMHGEEVLHPFFGFVRGWHREALNIMPPTPRRRGAWTVVLFGGSVAKDLARELRNALFQHFLKVGADIAPVFVDLAAGGFHQPQGGSIGQYGGERGAIRCHRRFGWIQRSD